MLESTPARARSRPAMRGNTRLAPTVLLLAALGCDHPAARIDREPATVPPSAESSAVGAASPAPSAEPPLIEREDIPLGKKCSFRMSRLDPAKPAFWSFIDPEWERRSGQRLVTCHFTLGAGIHPFDVEVATTPGQNSVESLTLHPTGEASPVTVIRGSLTIANWSSVDIEATDVNFDGVKDLVMPRSYGTSGCNSYHYLVYVPGSPSRPERFVDTAIQETCNPVVDPKLRQVITDMDDAQGIVHWRWDGSDFVRVR